MASPRLYCIRCLQWNGSGEGDVAPSSVAPTCPTCQEPSIQVEDSLSLVKAMYSADLPWAKMLLASGSSFVLAYSWPHYLSTAFPELVLLPRTQIACLLSVASAVLVALAHKSQIQFKFLVLSFIVAYLLSPTLMSRIPQTAVLSRIEVALILSFAAAFIKLLMQGVSWIGFVVIFTLGFMSTILLQDKGILLFEHLVCWPSNMPSEINAIVGGLACATAAKLALIAKRRSHAGRSITVAVSYAVGVAVILFLQSFSSPVGLAIRVTREWTITEATKHSLLSIAQTQFCPQWIDQTATWLSSNIEAVIIGCTLVALLRTGQCVAAPILSRAFSPIPTPSNDVMSTDHTRALDTILRILEMQSSDAELDLDESSLAGYYSALGSVLVSYNERVLAYACLTKAHDLFREAKPLHKSALRSYSTTCYWMAGCALLGSQKLTLPEIILLLKESLAISLYLGQHYEAARAVLGLARCCLLHGDKTSTVVYAELAKKILGMHGFHPELRAECFEISAIAGNWDDLVLSIVAARLLRNIAEMLGRAPHASYVNSLVDLSDLCSRTGQVKPSYELLIRATRLVERLRTSASFESARVNILGGFSSVYERLIILAVQLHRYADAFGFLEQAKARTFLEELGGALTQDSTKELVRLRLLMESVPSGETSELDASYLLTYVKELNNQRESQAVNARHIVQSVDYKAATMHKGRNRVIDLPFQNSQPADFGAVKSSLEENVLLAEYFVASSSVFLFIVRKEFDTPVVCEIPCDVNELRLFIAMNFSASYNVLNVAPEQWKMWAKLVEPISTVVRPTDIVCLIPNNLLHYLPLHALPIDGGPLIAFNPVVYTPSASILRFCAGGKHDRRRKALVFGDSREDLAGARKEALAVSHLFNTEPFIGTQATKVFWVKEASEADFIHIACHGEFDPEFPLASRILLAGEESISAYEVFGQSIHAELVTLSACQTGVSENRPGDELMGLVRAFLYAGASSTLASLWGVDDEATQHLMIRFYGLLLDKGLSKAQALQQAQMEVRAIAGWSHLYYWAPFVLIGDWH